MNHTKVLNTFSFGNARRFQKMPSACPMERHAGGYQQRATSVLFTFHQDRRPFAADGSEGAADGRNGGRRRARLAANVTDHRASRWHGMVHAVEE